MDIFRIYADSSHTRSPQKGSGALGIRAIWRGGLPAEYLFVVISKDRLGVAGPVVKLWIRGRAAVGGEAFAGWNRSRRWIVFFDKRANAAVLGEFGHTMRRHSAGRHVCFSGVWVESNVWNAECA